MTERADTAWLRSIARNTWDDSVSNAVFIAAAELETLRAATAWQPMSTAPKSGRPILVAHGGVVSLCNYKRQPGGYGTVPGFQPVFVDDDYVVQGAYAWMHALLPPENAP